MSSRMKVVILWISRSMCIDIRSTLWSTSVSRRGASRNERRPRILESLVIRRVLRLGILMLGRFSGSTVQWPNRQFQVSMERFVKVGIVKME